MYLLLYKSICCWYSFELPRPCLGNSNEYQHHMLFKEYQKHIAYVSSDTPLMNFSAGSSLKCKVLGRYLQVFGAF